MSRTAGVRAPAASLGIRWMTWFYFVSLATGAALVVMLNRIVGRYRKARIKSAVDMADALSRDQQPLLSTSFSVIDRIGRC